jgi:SAM-dependent methyltransferase
MPIQQSDDPAKFQQFEHSGWEAVSDGYEKHFAKLTAQSVPALLDAAGLEAGMRLLDVCTGPGMLAAAALDRGAAATGLDFSSQVIAIARRNVAGAAFDQGDAQDLPYDDASFDAVVCGYGIMHVPDPEQALREMRRVVKPGGRIALSVWQAPKPNNGFGVLFGAIKAQGNLDVDLPQGPDFFQFSEDETMIAALETVGLGEATCRLRPQTWEFDHPRSIVEAVMEGSVRARGLMLAQTDAARTAIEAAIAGGMEQFRTDQGRYIVPMPALIGAGRAAG